MLFQLQNSKRRVTGHQLRPAKPLWTVLKRDITCAMWQSHATDPKMVRFQQMSRYQRSFAPLPSVWGEERGLAASIQLGFTPWLMAIARGPFLHKDEILSTANKRSEMETAAASQSVCKHSCLQPAFHVTLELKCNRKEIWGERVDIWETGNETKWGKQARVVFIKGNSHVFCFSEQIWVILCGSV